MDAMLIVLLNDAARLMAMNDAVSERAIRAAVEGTRYVLNSAFHHTNCEICLLALHVLARVAHPPSLQLQIDNEAFVFTDVLIALCRDVRLFDLCVALFDTRACIEIFIEWIEYS